MLIPYGTVRRRRRIPWVTGSVIAANLLVYLVALAMEPEGFARLARDWGYVGARPERLYTLLTMMWVHDPNSFLHLHLIGNMWALLVFGPQVEDALGHAMFALYYVAGGIVSSLSQTAILAVAHVNQSVPTIGASGAVMAVLGMFAVRFYSTPVNTVVLVVPGVRLPAVLFLAIYIGSDIRQGLIETFAYHSTVGVAHWAHIGGFIFGAATGLLVGVVRQARREYVIERPVESAQDRLDRIAALRDLIRSDDTDAEAHLRYATLLDAEDRTHSEASEHYREALRLLWADGDLRRIPAAMRSFLDGGHSPAELGPELGLRVAAACERFGAAEMALGVLREVLADASLSPALREQTLMQIGAAAAAVGDASTTAWALHSLLEEFPFSAWAPWARASLRELRGHGPPERK